MKATDALPTNAVYYTRLSLRLYDAFVVHFTTPRAWRCNRHVILDHYEKHCASEDAEVGVGTGYFLAHLDRRWDKLSLIDPSTAALMYTSDRVTNAGAIEQYQANILDAQPELPRGAFKSVAANYVLHCLPGPMGAKKPAIRNLATIAANDGALFGATVLGVGVTSAPRRRVDAA